MRLLYRSMKRKNSTGIVGSVWNHAAKNHRKCEAILLASQGLSNHSIAQQTGLSRLTILAARTAFVKRGIDAIRERATAKPELRSFALM